MILVKEEKKDVEKKTQKYDVAMKRQEPKLVVLHEDKMEKLKEDARLRELDIRLRHEAQMKMFEALTKNNK